MQHPPAKFVILGQSRSGTQLLRGLLASHPLVHCDGELLHRNLEYTRHRALRELLRLYPQPLFERRLRQAAAPVYGFNLMFYHVAMPRRVMQRLARSGWTIFHLMREDLFDIAISYLIAIRSNLWHRNSGAAQPQYRVRIPATELDAELAKRVRWRETELGLLRGIPHLRLGYERDLQDQRRWQATCDRLFAALGIESRPVGSSFVRTDERGPEQIIENFDDLRAWLASSRYPELFARLRESAADPATSGRPSTPASG